MGRWVDGSMGQWVNGSMGRWVDGSMGRCVNGSMGRWANRSMGQWVDGSGCVDVGAGVLICLGMEDKWKEWSEARRFGTHLQSFGDPSS